MEEIRLKMESLNEEKANWRRRLEQIQDDERNRLNQEWTILENHNQLLIRENQVLMTQVRGEAQKEQGFSRVKGLRKHINRPRDRP